MLMFQLLQGRLLGCGGEFVEKQHLPHRRLLEMPGDTVMARGPGPPSRAHSCWRRRASSKECLKRLCCVIMTTMKGKVVPTGNKAGGHCPSRG